MNWPTIRLADLLSDARSGFASGDNLAFGLAQLRMNNVTADGLLDWSKIRRVETPKKVEDLLLRSGDVVFNATNSPELVGKNAYFESFAEAVTFSNHFLRLRPRSDVLDGKYLSYWLRKQFADGRFRGLCKQWVNQATVSRDILLDLRIPVPPLEEQRRIAAILDKAEELRAKRRATLALLDQLPQAIFLEMFGDPVSNPRSLPMHRFGEIGKLDRGISKHRPRNAPELLGGSHPLIQTGDVANCDGYITLHRSTYSDIGLRQSKKWPAGTLCITIAANIAKTGILEFDACFPDSVVGFCSEMPGLVEYVRVWLSFLQKTLEDSAPESAQKNINLAILRDLQIPVPDDRMLKSFEQRVDRIRRSKTHSRHASAQIDMLGDSLDGQYFGDTLTR